MREFVCLLAGGEKNERATDQSDDVLLRGVDGFQTQTHRQMKFDAVAGFPFAPDSCENAWNDGNRITLSVDRKRSASGPLGNSECGGELRRLGEHKVKNDHGVEGIRTPLCQ